MEEPGDYWEVWWDWKSLQEGVGMLVLDVSGVARIFCGEVLFTNKRNFLILYRVGVS